MLRMRPTKSSSSKKSPPVEGMGLPTPNQKQEIVVRMQ